jgi:hypothetical protein
MKRKYRYRSHTRSLLDDTQRVNNLCKIIKTFSASLLPWGKLLMRYILPFSCSLYAYKEGFFSHFRVFLQCLIHLLN